MSTNLKTQVTDEDFVEVERGLERTWNAAIKEIEAREDLVRTVRFLQNNFRTAFEALRMVHTVRDANAAWMKDKAGEALKELSVAFCAARAEEENQARENGAASDG